MKKTSIAIMAGIISLASLKATAQSTTSATTNTNPGGIYLKGGWNLANISTNGDGTISDKHTLSSFNVGVLGDIPLNDMFSVQTGLFLQGRGSKTDYFADPNNKDNNYVKTRFRPLYLQIPADFVIKVPLSNQARVFLGAGPYVEMGIGGKSKVETNVGGVVTTSSSTIKFNDDDPTTGDQEGARYDRLKRFGVGINALAGVEFNRIAVGVGYDWGLTKINSTQTDNGANDKNKYRTFSVNLGIRLN
ncbi:porin family protein [Deminuibacter soli]|nr:porin family protein [Deminuibacter soli]